VFVGRCLEPQLRHRRSDLLAARFEPLINPLDPKAERPSLDISAVDGAVVVRWDSALMNAPPRWPGRRSSSV
jgi:hypothetical protein